MVSETDLAWIVNTVSDDERHVIPHRDQRLHMTATCCWCRPQEGLPGLWKHNPLDKRPMAGGVASAPERGL
jgi:hypothetical protein